MSQEWHEIVKHLKEYRAHTGVILGSGMSAFTDSLAETFTLPYRAIPGMPTSAVPGHSGALVAGFLEGVSVITMSGRIHAYEGYTASQVAFPVDILSTCGARTLITTNAVGAVNENYEVGDIMVVSDHINLTGMNPLTGVDAHPGKGRFVPMADAYDPAIRATLLDFAEKNHLPVREGVLAAVNGPSYETAAEVRMLRLLGADATGMSVVHETVRARWHGMRVAALSGVTNKATGVGAVSRHTHESVLEAGHDITANMVALIGAAVDPEAGHALPGFFPHR